MEGFYRKERKEVIRKKKAKAHWWKLGVQDDDSFSLAKLWCFPLAGLVAGLEENLLPG